MANDASKIIAGGGKVGGYAYSAPVGSTLPTDVSTALNAAFDSDGLGYITDDGVARSITVDTEEERDWNGDVVKVIQTEVGVEFTITLMELNENALNEVYGADAVTVAGDLVSISFTGATLPHRAFVFELAEGDLRGRLVIPDGQVSNPGGGDTTFAKSASIKHEVTIRAYRHTDGSYFKHYQETAADVEP